MNEEDNFLYKRAQYWATHSRDPSTRVGAVVTDYRMKIAGEDHNHLARGTPEEWWHDRELKYAHVVHAEAGALLRAGSGAYNGTLYSSAHPCQSCAILAVASGVSRIVCPEHPWREDPAVMATVEQARATLNRGGIVCEYV